MCVEALAGLVASLGSPRLAAGLFGMAAALRQRIGSPVAANDRPGYEADVSALRAVLGDDVFAAAWTGGEEASLEELLAQIPWGSLVAPTRQRRRPASRADTYRALTRREREVLAFVAKGQTDKEIAQHLSISPATVTKHVGNALRKLGAPSRGAAAMLLFAPGASVEPQPL
jgi:DNA-binding CsgD family transcriptional regulator